MPLVAGCRGHTMRREASCEFYEATKPWGYTLRGVVEEQDTGASTGGRLRYHPLSLPCPLKNQEPGCVHMFPSDASVSERSESFP